MNHIESILAEQKELEAALPTISEVKDPKETMELNPQGT